MQRIVIARVGAAHGIKGEVRLKTFTENPMAAAEYAPLEAADGRVLEIESARQAGETDMLVVRFKGIADRNAAEGLNGIELSVPRDRLPPAEADEFYHADLIGLAAVGGDGEPLGKVIGVANYGAGDLLEIAPGRGPTLLIPFTNQAVPEIDLAAGRVVVVRPREIEAGEEP